MNKVIYQLTTEDVSHFLTNKEHLNEVVRRIQKDFSCIWKAKRVKRRSQSAIII